MKITIHAKPNSKKQGIEKLNESEWVIKIREQPKDGEANEAVIEAISKEFKIAKSKIKIVRGEKSRTKLIEILD